METRHYLHGEEIAKAKKLFGIEGFNKPPANFEEVDEAYVAQHGDIFGAYYRWYDQIDHNGEWLSIHCFGHQDGSGIAVSADYWGKKLRWFKFAGCVHEWRAPTREECAKHHTWPGMCMHISVCNKCGYFDAVDSSD